MSVSSTTNKIIYTGSGTTGPFDFDFKVFASSDLVVEKFTIATEVTTVLIETTDYTVTIDVDGTGSVTTVAAVTSAYKLIIRRVLPITQAIDYVEGDKFPAETHEEGLDRSRMIDQQLQEQIDRCVKVPSVETEAPDYIEVLAEATSAATTAKDAAVVAQGLAEEAKDDAVVAQGLAEEAKDDAVTAQGLAEAARDTAIAQVGTVVNGSINFVIDGNSAPIVDGIAGDLIIPFDMTLTGWTLLADQSGAIKLDVWKDTYANFPPTDADTITNGHEPEISASGVKAQDLDIADWVGEAVAAGSVLRFNVDSVTAITRCTLILNFTRTV